MLNTIKNIADGWLRHSMNVWLKKYKPTNETQAYLDDRFSVCMSCDHMSVMNYPGFDKDFRFCGKCKCAFPSLIFAYEKRCPDGRWDKIPKDVRES